MSVEGSAPAVFIHNLCDQFWAGLLLLSSSSSSSSFLSFFRGTMSCICFHNVADMVGKPHATFHNTPVLFFCRFQKASRAVKHPFQFLEWKQVSVNALRQERPVRFRGGGNICIVVARTKDREGQKLSSPINTLYGPSHKHVPACMVATKNHTSKRLYKPADSLER